jgi:hypothetical protein
MITSRAKVMWNIRKIIQLKINFYLLLISALSTYSVALSGAESINLKSKSVNDDGFLTEVKDPRSIHEICSDSGFRKQQNITYLSADYSNCPSENNYIANYHLSADNPHLRLDINLKRIEQQNIAGSGIQSTSNHSTNVDIIFESLSADLVTPHQTGLIHFVGTTVANPPLPIFTAFIENGCLGSPLATFELSLTSTIYTDLYKDHSLGSVQLYDQVVGHGYYNYNYTIRAEDDQGNISDFTFSGDADSTCVNQLSVN